MAQQKINDAEVKIELYGRVQGVGFRHFIKHNADGLGLSGLVMNRDDGSLLVIAQGKKEKLEVFLNIVQKGPRFSKVEGVSFRWKEPKNQYENFAISLNSGIINDQKKSFLNLGRRVLFIKDRIPRHVAIIPDGNRRWAKKNGLGKLDGHKKSGSYGNLVALIEGARRLGVEYITFWAFSTENWKRDKKETDFLFDLALNTLEKFEKYAFEKKIRFRHFGRKDRLPGRLVSTLEHIENETVGFDGIKVNLCLDYGGRDEIVRAVNKLLKAGVQEVKEDDIVDCLDSAGIPDPDLVIRTSGEKRMSGFMPFQSAYSELYFADVHFPDFTPTELRKAIKEFGKRGRRFGK